MTHKEVIKLILIMHGYDKNITIESRRCIDDISTEFYEVHAFNDEDDCVFFHEPGLEMMLSAIFEYFHPKTYKNSNPDYVGAYINDLLNDKWREDIKKEQKKLKQKQEEHFKKYKEYFDFLEKIPCKECKINKHDHWDDIHYNCEGCHTMSCKILRKHYDDADKIKKSIDDRSNKESTR